VLHRSSHSGVPCASATDVACDGRAASTEPASVREWIAADLEAWRRAGMAGSGRWAALGALWSHCGARATLLYRVSNLLHRRGVRVLPQVLSRLNLTLYGLDIPPSVPIGPGLYVPHPVGTVVMADRIGANVTLVSGVTIGVRKGAQFPRIGDNVYVGAGARVLGGIEVGSNVSIGANAVVIEDVPTGAVAVGVPAQVRFPAASVLLRDQHAEHAR